MYLLKIVTSFLVLAFTSLCLASNTINLSNQEILFIQNNPEVKLGGGESFAPYIFKDEDGKVSGYDREFADLIEQKTGLKVVFELGVWNDIQALASKGELDGLSTAVITKDRQKIYNFTKPYITHTTIALVNRANPQKIFKKEDVQNKRAAVQKGNKAFDRVTQSLGDVEIVYYDDIYAVLNAVVNNEVDFTILDESVYSVANKLGISDFISTSFVVSKGNGLHLALTKKKPLLVSIFNKALNDITPQQLSEIKKSWFKPQHKALIQFTIKEKAYLSERQSIKYCIDRDFYPIESYEDGKHIGVSADFLKEFEQHITIPFQLVETQNWYESIEAVKNGQCDFLPMAMKTPQRDMFFNFTKPYLSTPLVLATLFEAPFSQDLQSLNNKKIGIVKGYAYGEIIKQKHPDIDLVVFDSILEGLEKVELGELYGFIDTLANISHKFQQGHTTQLKISGRFDEKWELSVATRKGDDILKGIFDKLTATIGKEQQRDTLNKYVPVSYESFVDYTMIYQVVGIALFLLVLILYWNYRIKKENHALDKRYEELKCIKNKIQKNETRLQITLEHGHIGTWELNVVDGTARCSRIFDKIFGYDSTSPSWNYSLFLEHVVQEERAKVDALMQEAITKKQDVCYEYRIMRNDGSIRWVFGSGGPKFDNQGQVTSMSGVTLDITDLKNIELEKIRHNAELQSLLNALPDIYFRMSHDGVILDYHAPDKNDLYLKPEEFVGKVMQDLLPKEVGELFKLKLEELEKSAGTKIFTYTLPVNNKVRHFDARLNNISFNGRSVNDQIVCVIRDVTDEFKSKEYLAASEQLFRLFFEHAAIGVALLSADTAQFIRVNQRFCDMLGYTIEEMTNGKTYKDITHPDDLQISANYLDNVLEGHQREVTLEKRYVHKDGHIVWIELNISPSQHTDEGSQPVIVVIQDITDRKKADEKLKLAATVFTHAAEGIVITDENAVIIDVNETFTSTTGYTREEAIGQNPRFLKSGRQSDNFYVDMWQQLKKHGYWSGEVWNRRKNDEVYAEMLNISLVKDTNGEISNYVGLFTDITVMKEHQGQLEHTAHYDLLTDLPNRSLLADRLTQAMLQCSRHNQSLAVVFLDLDGFKAINDSHGHDVGDELLIALSERMKNALREGDTFSRIGGDEFVAVLADLAKVEDCEPVLERLLLAASESIIINDVELNVSASIGVTLFPQDNVDTDILMRHADQAMYIAKASGKNRYHFFNTAQDDAIKAQRESLEAIRNALDNDQLVLHYQPKVNMNSGTVTGVEALIRWQHPTRGLLNPIDFLPTIENHPMSVEVGEWVINTALTQISLWQKQGISLPVSTSVNIAATQLQKPNFTERLAFFLNAHPDVQPEFLELEVLETSALEDVQNVSKIMEACMSLGVKFALDDFGTGYSSLTYLRRLPASLIKIDQSFVRDMLDDADDLAIIEGVIALAKSFKRDVIAEGVETIEHGTALLALGCELAQGYGIAKPMPASDIPSWIRDWKPDESWKVIK